MKINWRKDEDREVLALAKATKFREVRKIHFDKIIEENKEVLEYLVSNSPLKLIIFAFDAYTGSGLNGNGDFYVKGIEKVSVWVV